MIIRSKAPLRIGLAGGGTDVSPYSDLYGGSILNTTINLYAYATIIPKSTKKIVLNSVDLKRKIELKSEEYLSLDNNLDLVKAVYNRIVKDFKTGPLSFELQTFVDAPPGSGLGSSSTLVVAIVGAFVEWLRLPLGEYDIAKLAYSIEREDMKLDGGKQDQYSATFGGFNFMEFYKGDKVIVNPLRIRHDYINELEQNILLYYTGTSRLSHEIIKTQKKNVKIKNNVSIEAMHKLKEQSIIMKEALLMGDLLRIGKILDFGWKYKKRIANEISNIMIDEIYQVAKMSGASGGKISGAGGGGYMIFFCPGNNSYKVKQALQKFGGVFQNYQFVKTGLISWTIK